MKHWKVFIVALVLAGCTSGNRELPPLGEGALEIDDFLGGMVDSGRIPGVVALVTDRDGVLYQGAFGWQNEADEIPMAPDSVFRIYSMTKPITSVAVMMLVEEGRVGLDDPVSEYLPELASPEVFDEIDLDAGTYTSRPANGEITIRQLLNHTSGLGYWFSSPVLARFLAPNQRATELPLLHDPGERWTYGESTRVLGDVIEAASGQLLDTFIRNRILRPLGMEDTSYSVLEDRYPRLVTTHQREDGRLVETPNPDPPVYFEVRGDSRLTSTAADYAKFLRMLLNQGTAGTSESAGARLISVETVGEMTRNQIGDLRVREQPVGDPVVTRPFPLGAGRDTFGFGFQITGPGGPPDTRSPGSYSWSGLQNTHFWVDPVEGIAGIVMMQVFPFYDDAAIEVLQGFEQRVYQSRD